MVATVMDAVSAKIEASASAQEFFKPCYTFLGIEKILGSEARLKTS